MSDFPETTQAHHEQIILNAAIRTAAVAALDSLTVEHTSQSTFTGLLLAKRRPRLITLFNTSSGIEGVNASERLILANAYDRAQKERGDKRRAIRK